MLSCWKLWVLGPHGPHLLYAEDAHLQGDREDSGKWYRAQQDTDGTLPPGDSSYCYDFKETDLDHCNFLYLRMSGCVHDTFRYVVK